MPMWKKRRTLSEAATHVARRLLVAALLGVTACSGGSGRPDAADGSLPEIVSLELSPQPAYANSALTVVVKLKALGGPRVHHTYQYQWRKNSQVIDGAAGETLPNTFFRKGDVVTVTVTAQSGPQQGAAVTSPPVTIRNSVPIVTAVGMTPAPLHHHIAVRAVVQSSDADGDDLTYSYQWFKNDKRNPDQTGETLDGNLLEKGDRIQVQATPSDGEATGEARMSTPVTVHNTPPRITSQPPVSLNADDTYLYQVVAEDPDGDPIIYSLTSAPAGMTIDPENGLIRWKVTRKDQGIHPIEITVANADGAKTMQRYDLRIDDLAEKSVPPHS